MYYLDQLTVLLLHNISRIRKVYFNIWFHLKKNKTKQYSIICSFSPHKNHFHVNIHTKLYTRVSLHVLFFSTIKFYMLSLSDYVYQLYLG